MANEREPLTDRLKRFEKDLARIQLDVQDDPEEEWGRQAVMISLKASIEEIRKEIDENTQY